MYLYTYSTVVTKAYFSRESKYCRKSDTATSLSYTEIGKDKQELFNATLFIHGFYTPSFR